MAATVRAVLFDLDNTLHDRDQTFEKWAGWFARNRLGSSSDVDLGETVERLVALDAGGYTPKDSMFREPKRQHPCLVEEVEALVAAFRDQLWAHLGPIERGTANLLSALDRAGVPWGIVTNGSSSQLRKVDKLGLSERTCCVIVSELVGVRKPTPAIFRAAAERLRVDPRDTLFVGDNPEADIVGAAQAGMRTAWLRRTREWPTHLASIPPSYTIDSLTELLWIAATAPEPGGP